ncbi:hypothetical protein PF002_g22906 [Phytophthora fragariae]|uniref:Uncharacterized protein n=2 Tax=Phytophthora TaxID=4783 RepID=A0A6A3QU10_9STRA|nr:hypothetical protein PF003_g35176 [Phytophthora fragariae]KAE9083318.1 hypothetical protein PF007_g21949 [Phytophthora fragariae]KAE9196891.1 hypothetical protein PF002_g22906 [Phytophthora fragariae]KAE9346254.1 hypothetical protein PR003_g7530 [Phytophthora rubi]
MESSAEKLSAEEVTAAECLAAEGLGMEVLDEEVHKVLENFIEKKSKDVYLYGISRYVVWLHGNKATLL